MYVQRTNGKITTASRYPLEGVTEELADDDAELVAYLKRDIAPTIISDRQFFHALALSGLITQDEALDAVKYGTPPAAMEAVLLTLNPADQFNARMLIEGATSFSRNNPLVALFGASSGMTDEQIDQLWALASSL